MAKPYTNMGTKYEIHHGIPLNRFGDDSEGNRIKLTVPQHKLVHATLGNTPRGTQLMRSYRKAYNSRIVLPISAIADQEEILQDYFLDLHKLPPSLQEKHVRCVRAVTLQLLSSNLLGLEHARGFINEVDSGIWRFKSKNVKKKTDSWPTAMDIWLRRRTRVISLSVNLVHKCVQIGLVSMSVADSRNHGNKAISRLVQSVSAIP